MRCFSCSKLSLNVFCNICQAQLLKTTISTRKIGTMDVISFYKYDVVEPLLLQKHTPQGYRIYKSLAKLTMKPFIEEFSEHDRSTVYIIGIDETIKNGYSHVSLLTCSMKTINTTPLHAVLLAKNKVQYAGKSLQFRLDNPRNFTYTGKQNIDVVLIDDIITTGVTLQEAKKVLQANNVNVLFALTLATVK